jgi:malonyl CoA-acyl carrier protein transacylase
MYPAGVPALWLVMSVAFLYPGEGSERAGMAAALHATDRAVLDRHLRLAGDVTGLPVRRLCLEGSAEQLVRPDVGQPALFALCLALTEVARAHGVEPAMAAGRGVGELAAAVATGALDPVDGMRLVALRSRLLAYPGGEDALARRARAMAWRPAAIPVALNAFGGLVTEPDAIRSGIVAAGAIGDTSASWHDCLHALTAAGASAFLELGPAAAPPRALQGEWPAAVAGSRADIAAFARDREAALSAAAR